MVAEPMLARRAPAAGFIRGPAVPAWAVLALELGRLLSPPAASGCGTPAVCVRCPEPEPALAPALPPAQGTCEAKPSTEP